MKKAVFGLMASIVCLLAVEVGSVPSDVTLSGKDGGKTDGTPWHSSMLKGKVHVLFYVDPDEKDLNEDLVQALKKRHFDRKKYGSVAVVNLAATWKPNVIIEALLKKKQKAFPDTVYVKDKRSVLVKQWQLADNNSDILVFDKQGKLIYKKFGKLSKAEIDKVLKLIEKNL
ncbi:MAG: YtfJ family protein [Sulfurovum sp.]|nr:YtfJ family protein [Sulfurovum sp.]